MKQENKKGLTWKTKIRKKVNGKLEKTTDIQDNNQH